MRTREFAVPSRTAAAASIGRIASLTFPRAVCPGVDFLCETFFVGDFGAAISIEGAR